MEEMIITDNVGTWRNIIKETHEDEIFKLKRQYPHKKSIFLDFNKLDRIGFSKKVRGKPATDYLISDPDETTEIIKDSIQQEYLLYRRDDEDSILKEPEEYDNINIRYYNLPRSVKIRDIRSKHLGQLIQIEGTISKQTYVRPRVISAVFKCLECGTLTPQLKQKDKNLTEPYQNCEHCGKKTKMEIVDSKSVIIDAQKMRVQENYDIIVGSEQPHNIDIDIKDDLCSLYQPGNRVIVTGILRSRLKNKYGNKQTDYDIYIDAHCIRKQTTTFNEIEITAEDKEQILKFARENNVLDRISESIAYSIYGYTLIKKAVALQLVGGNRTRQKDGTWKRGDSHILLAADPSTAKSVILKSVIRISPRGIFVTGKGSSAAGLTATAVKDEFNDNNWSLEAGALVLASGGNCAIDEINTMSKSDMTSLLNAMEQQEVNIAKAGMNATFQTQTAIIAALNPKLGRFDDFIPLAEQIDLTPQLISRFDLIFKMRDIPNQDTDKKIAMRMLEDEIEYWVEEKEYLSEEFIRKYIAYSKQNYTPKFTKEAAETIANYYVNERQSSDTLSITARQNGGLRRLSQAHAKLRLSEKVEETDAKAAIEIVESCIKEIATTDGVLDIDNMLGVPNKRTRDITRAIYDYIETNKTIINDRKDVIDKTEMIKILESQGHDKTKIEKRIKQMQDDGILIEPQFNLIKKL